MNKVVLVTGGAKRIGKSICKKFHENGFSIICHYNSSDEEAERKKKHAKKKSKKEKKKLVNQLKFLELNSERI